jgi:hypothetical protein
MKRHITTGLGITVIVSALLACNLALADISTVSNDVNTATWDAVGGNAPFYTTSLSGLSGQGFPGTSADPYVVLSETFTITSGAGGLTASAAGSNYQLNAISIVAGGGNGPIQVHMFDVTTNLTSNNGSVYNGSGATYNFVANGDLLGNGFGLTFTNNLPGERQEIIVLGNGPNSQDQIVLGTNHTYALEFWAPTSSVGNLIWYRSANADSGGEAMGSHAGSLSVPRLTITSLGLAGGAPRTFGAALYGSPTTSAWSANSNTNLLSGPPPATTNFIVDNFSTNGVGPQNPLNDDYYSSSNNYAAGQITNVWWNWFGGAFSNTAYAPGVYPPYAPSQGSLAINLDWVGGGAAQQFELWDQGPTNNFYSVNLSALTYTNFSCDVMYAPGSATNSSGTFGNLQFGNRPPGYSQDYFGGGNNGITVNGTNAGVWQHVSIALNPVADTNLLTIQGLLIHTYDGGGTITGPSTIYVDNIEFSGPLVVTKVPPPSVSIQPTVPGLRMFVGSSATYIREGVITTQGSGESESWVGAGGPVTYSFQLLSYPAANIGVTELAILPEASFNPTANFQTTIYKNPFLDFQDSNGFYVVIAPHGGGSVTAAVQWKVGLPSPSGAMTNLVSITNSTAIGTWTLTMNSSTSGTLTAPGGQSANFSFSDPNVSSDFANPTVAAVFEDPNSTAGYGLYEDIGTISITGTASGTQTENFANETSDFSNGTSPGGYYQNNYSVDPGNLVITRTGLDKYWVNWTSPAVGFNLITDTNIQANPTNWVSPIYYSDYNIPDETAPRGAPTQFGSKYWVLLPSDDLPTADGSFQPSPPAVTDPLSPNAYFMLTTNTAFIYPVTP